MPYIKPKNNYRAMYTFMNSRTVADNLMYSLQSSPLPLPRRTSA